MKARFTNIASLSWLILTTSVPAFCQIVGTDSLKTAINAPTSKDTIFGQKAKKIIPKKLYDFLFRDIYNTSNGSAVSEIEENPYRVYEGRWIRKININNLNVFGHSVYDTTRQPSNKLDRLGNKLHTKTRHNVVLKRFLFFEEGDLVKPELMQDNERYLRQQGVFHDVRIIVVPYKNVKDAVDVYVITQDLWSLIPAIAANSFNDFSIGIDQQNFRGLAHSWKNTVAYNGNDDRQKTEFSSRYFIPSLGKSFVSAQADFDLLRDNKLNSVKFFRPFLTPETKYAGSVEFNFDRSRTFEFSPDSTNLSKSIRSYFWTRSLLFDTWLGRSFKLPFGNQQFRERTRLIVAARRTQQDFFKREREVTDSSYQLYQNTKLTLFSLGFSNRRYKRDLLIYGFGRTEDVPTGELVSLVYGFDDAETGERSYAGIKLSAARYFKFGYLYSLLNMGSYWQNNKPQQGVFGLENNYFTTLKSIGKRWYTRQFINLRYTLGINRFNNEYLNIGGKEGIQGISSDELRGTKKIILGLESVFFSPINFIGFRIAPFISADLGWVSEAGKSLLNQPLFQGYGIGFRFRNESLTFDNFQIRFSYYSGIPDLPNPIRVGFDSVSPLRLRDFAVTTPEIVAFR